MSGGADSTALAVLAVAAGCRAELVHVDHGLRPDSHREADLVLALGERLGISGTPTLVAALIQYIWTPFISVSAAYLRERDEHLELLVVEVDFVLLVHEQELLC